MSAVKRLARLKAPAKINWFLHITGRRADGKHMLQSAMQLIDLCDEMSFDLRDDGVIHRIDLGATPADMPSSDLSVRAAQLLQAHCGVTLGCTLTLDKRIPSGAGLGGGSSDAALTLAALNQLWSCGLSREELMALGLQLGSDVPYFLFGRTAWAEGIGEQLHALEVFDVSSDDSAQNGQPLLLIKPERGVATAQAYGHVLLKRDTPAVPRLTRISMRSLWQQHTNDLQPVAELIEPGVSLALELAQAHGGLGQARMSGSGSAVFAPRDPKLSYAPRLPAGFSAYCVRTLQTHPGLAALRPTAPAVHEAAIT
jgi:4-diphosphocytidyl-2-C-methyl-D-erythritol kinase